MKVLRPATCLVVAVSLAVAGTAAAATKPVAKKVCNLVVDPAGDASLQAPLPADEKLDIVGADVASNAKAFTAVIRVKNLSAATTSQLGNELRLQFDLPGAEAPVWFGYASSAYGGEAFQYGVIGKGTGGSTSPTGDAVGVVDTAKNEIRMTVSVSELSALGKAKPGSKVSNLSVTAAQLIGVAPNASGVYGFLSQPVDDATGKSYVAGAPSCVVPGK